MQRLPLQPYASWAYHSSICRNAQVEDLPNPTCTFDYVFNEFITCYVGGGQQTEQFELAHVSEKQGAEQDDYGYDVG